MTGRPDIRDCPHVINRHNPAPEGGRQPEGILNIRPRLAVVLCDLCDARLNTAVALNLARKVAGTDQDWVLLIPEKQPPLVAACVQFCPHTSIAGPGNRPHALQYQIGDQVYVLCDLCFAVVEEGVIRDFLRELRPEIPPINLANEQMKRRQEARDRSADRRRERRYQRGRK